VQLTLNIRKALKAGATGVELAEALWQIGIYAGTPAAIAALNTLVEVLKEDAA
jgi:alkylhydroperoxidase/carboxymuconolactone decarboxylase family protein YurZ